MKKIQERIIGTEMTPSGALKVSVVYKPDATSFATLKGAKLSLERSKNSLFLESFAEPVEGTDEWRFVGLMNPNGSGEAMFKSLALFCTWAEALTKCRCCINLEGFKQNKPSSPKRRQHKP